uniref:RING-type domain-containing protein n=3 Tax=Lotharella globosa TaxID=91324 RepID=A0A6V3K858_9EUKA
MANLPNGKIMRVQVPPGAQPGTRLRVTYLDKGPTDGSMKSGDSVRLLTRIGGKTHQLTPNTSETEGDQRLIWVPTDSKSPVPPFTITLASPSAARGAIITDGDSVVLLLARDPRSAVTVSPDGFVAVMSGKSPTPFTLHVDRQQETKKDAPPVSGTTTGPGAAGVVGAGIFGSLAAAAITQFAEDARRTSQRGGGAEHAMMAAAAAAMAPTVARAVDTRYGNNPLQLFNDLKTISGVMNGASRAAGQAAIHTANTPEGAALLQGMAAMALTNMNQAQQRGPSNVGVPRARTGPSAGMDRTAIEGYPTNVVKEGAPVENCIICLDDMAPGNTCRRLPCFHSFHKGCIDAWLARNSSCPICKRNVR